MSVNNTNSAVYNANETISAHEYRYDKRGNIVKKILPQCQYTQYWYDHGDKVIFMQDANLRTKNKYRFMLYDRLGRLCVQGLCDSFDHSVNVSNGNIEHLQRRGRKQDGHVGKIDNLSIFHHGNQLSSVVDDAAKIYYAGISRKGLLYKSYLINEDGTLMRYATPQEQIDTTIFDVCNMNILILLKGRNGNQKHIFWDRVSIKYISQDTLIEINPVREVLYINSSFASRVFNMMSPHSVSFLLKHFSF